MNQRETLEESDEQIQIGYQQTDRQPVRGAFHECDGTEHRERKHLIRADFEPGEKMKRQQSAMNSGEVFLSPTGLQLLNEPYRVSRRAR